MDSSSFPPLAVEYDPDGDILYLLFAEHAQEAIAEEVQPDVFVRFEPESRRIVDIEILHLRDRLMQIFGPELEYTGSPLPEMVTGPLGIEFKKGTSIE